MWLELRRNWMTWWSRVRRIRRSAAGSSRACFRPALERLEDRTLRSAGQLDPTFGVGGKITTDFQGQVSAVATGAVLQSDGKIVVAGYGANSHFLPCPLHARRPPG